MSLIHCRYRSTVTISLAADQSEQPVCQVVAELTALPLKDCHVNDSACAYCLQCRTAPHAPNPVTASMSIHAAQRSEKPDVLKSMLKRMTPHLNKVPPPVTRCVLRGPETRQVQCKPCQADRLQVVMVPVFRCPKHQECTLHNLGVHPRIQACATCEDRLERSYPLEARPIPLAVLQTIQKRRE